MLETPINNICLDSFITGVKLIEKDIEEQWKGICSFFIDIIPICCGFYIFTESLEGNIKEEQKEELFQIINDIKSIYQITEIKKKEESKNIFLTHSIGNIDQFQKFCHLSFGLNNLIRTVRNYELWIPYKASTEDLLLLVKNEVNERDKIEEFVLSLFEADEVVEGWKNSLLFSDRYKLLVQSIDAYKLGLFYPCINGLLGLLDYSLIKLLTRIDPKNTKRNANRKMLENLSNLIEQKIGNKDSLELFSMPLNELVNTFQFKSFSTVLKEVVFEQTENLNQEDGKISRHGFLHGVFTKGFNQRNTKLLLLLLDEINYIYDKIDIISVVD